MDYDRAGLTKFRINCLNPGLVRPVRGHRTAALQSGFAIDECLLRHRLPQMRVGIQDNLAHDVVDVRPAQTDAVGAVSDEIATAGR